MSDIFKENVDLKSEFFQESLKLKSINFEFELERLEIGVCKWITPQTYIESESDSEYSDNEVADEFIQKREESEPQEEPYFQFPINVNRGNDMERESIDSEYGLQNFGRVEGVDLLSILNQFDGFNDSSTKNKFN